MMGATTQDWKQWQLPLDANTSWNSGYCGSAGFPDGVKYFLDVHSNAQENCYNGLN